MRKKILTKLAVWLLFCFQLSSCALVQKTHNWITGKEDRPIQKGSSYPSQYRTGEELHRQGQFAAAGESFIKASQEVQVGKIYYESLFYAGWNFELAGQYSRAQEILNEVVTGAHLSFPEIGSRAVYRLSFVYENLGAFAKAYASLVDAYGSRLYLPEEVKKAELPARMAGFSARIGQQADAGKLYEQAEQGIKELRKKVRQQGYQSWYTRTLYYMGSFTMGAFSWENFREKLIPIEKGQKYLLEAIEFSDDRWARLSAERLVDIYKNLWQTIVNYPRHYHPDPVLAERIRQERQAGIAIAGIEVLESLKRHRFPQSKHSELTQSVFAQLSGYEKKFYRLMTQPMAGEEAIPQSQTGRPVYTVDPDPRLEELFRK